MAEKEENGAKISKELDEDAGTKTSKEFDEDARFRYLGFEVYPGKKLRDFFKSDAEKDSLVERIKEKRQRGKVLRDVSSFDVPRLAGYEKVVLTITSLIIIFSLFLPWFSGYRVMEVVVEKPDVKLAGETAAVDVADTLGDTLIELEGEAEALAEGEATDTQTPPGEEMAEDVAPPEGAVTDETDEQGFTSITGVQKSTKIEREHLAVSGIGVIGGFGNYIGKVFSSGFVLILTGILFLVYMLMCLITPIYTIYLLYAGKIDDDERALKVKKAMRINWIPLIIWVAGMILAIIGANYGFGTDEMVRQIGSNYTIGTYLGLLSFGFYISLAMFVMNAVKGAEI